MKTRVFLTLGLLSLATVSCKKDLDVNLRQGAADKTGTLTICTNSTLTGTKLAGVKIHVVGSPKDSTVTGTDGTARLQLPAGSYELMLQADGYAPIYSDPVKIEPLNGTSDTPIFGETHQEIDMYAIGATLTGRVVMQSTSADKSNAYVQNATVAITNVNGHRLTEPILTTTDAEGLYTLEAPVNVSFGTEFYYVQDGQSYSAGINSGILRKGETKQLASTMLMPIGSTYSADIVTLPTQATDPLKITFPVAVATIFDYDDLAVQVSGADSLKFSFADNDRTLSITPLPRYTETDPNQIALKKKWSTGTHSFYISNLKGAEGETLNAFGNFTIATR